MIMETPVNTFGHFPELPVGDCVSISNKRFLNCHMYAWALAETS